MADSEVECLSELFRCFICMQQLQNAQLCPHCSKLCCAPCIERWLMEQRQQCPHCREPLQRDELVKCRWAEEVTTQLDLMRSLNSENKVMMERLIEKDKCSQHVEEKLSVFCCSCQICICHQCALFVGQHSGHTFKPLNEEYEIHKNKITDEISALRRRLKELEGLKRDINKNVDNIKYAKEDREQEMKMVVDNMIKKLDHQLKAKLDKLKGQKNSICNETEFLEKILEKVERELKQKSKSELISSVGHLMDMFSKVHETPMTNFVSAPVPADFVSEIVPQYQSSNFTLHSFSMLKRKADPVYSSSLNCCGIKWRLKVYPDGNGVARSNYLSVFLELVEGVQETSKYEYKVEMLHLQHRGIRNIVREFASDFEVGECWGYNRFFRLDQLEEEGFLDSEEDCVVLKFHVRPPTFAQKCRDQAWYIQQLEESHAQHVEQLHNLKLSLRENSRTQQDTGATNECVPARHVSGRMENSIEVDDMNSTRHVDELLDLAELPPPFENSDCEEEDEEEEEEEDDQEDSTLQKIRESIQTEVHTDLSIDCDSQSRPLSADSWERRLMNQIGVSSFPGTQDTLDSSQPESELGSVQSVLTDELEPELIGLVDSESETELPTLNNFTPDIVQEPGDGCYNANRPYPHPRTLHIPQSMAEDEGLTQHPLSGLDNSDLDNSGDSALDNIDHQFHVSLVLDEEELQSLEEISNTYHGGDMSNHGNTYHGGDLSNHGNTYHGGEEQCGAATEIVICQPASSSNET